MEATVVITILALMQYMLFGVQVGSSRGKHGVKAPAQTGHEEFERMNRVHLNTLEQLVVFVPALWMHAFFADAMWGAVIGVFYLIGRIIYRSAYLKDPGSRTLGFMLSFLPSAVLMIWTLVVVVPRLI